MPESQTIMDHRKKSQQLLSLSILYVEDEKDIRCEMEQFLNRRFKRVTVAKNGKEGITLYHQVSPDIIITDLKMPLMNGLKMAEEIRKTDPDIPIVVTTALNESALLLKSIDIGISKYVLKPVDTKLLIKSVLESATLLFQRREIEAKNRYIHYLLDINPTFICTHDKTHLKYINKSFLNYLGYDTLKQFKKHHLSILEMIRTFDDAEFQFPEKKALPINLMVIIKGKQHRVSFKSKNTDHPEEQFYLMTANEIPDAKEYLLTFTDITEIEKEKSQLKEKALLDSLTGIYNRRMLKEVFTNEINRFERYRTPFSAVLFDIDHFKRVNDQFGHEAGDHVLKALSGIVKKRLRQNDYFFRYGGEEFLIAMPHTPLENAAVICDRLRMEIENYHFKQVERITVSFGISECRKDDTISHLIQRTDKALYQAKEKGRNRVECFPLES